MDSRRPKLKLRGMELPQVTRENTNVNISRLTDVRFFSCNFLMYWFLASPNICGL